MHEDCIYRELSGERSCAHTMHKRGGCFEDCLHYTVQSSLQPTVDDVVSPLLDGTQGQPCGVGVGAGQELEPVPDADVPAGPIGPAASRDHCRSEIRPVVFGVAGPGTRGASVPVFAMVCGIALDGRCPHPCSFGMYSIDIGRAHARVEPAGRILTSAGRVPRVRRN